MKLLLSTENYKIHYESLVFAVVMITGSPWFPSGVAENK